MVENMDSPKPLETRRSFRVGPVLIAASFVVEVIAFSAQMPQPWLVGSNNQGRFETAGRSWGNLEWKCTGSMMVIEISSERERAHTKRRNCRT